MGSTGRVPGSPGRRRLLKACAAAPLALLARRAAAADYASASEALAEMDRLAIDVGGRLTSLSNAVPASRPFARSALLDQGRHAGTRSKIRSRLRLPGGPPAPASQGDPGLHGLRAAQQALVFAYAEGLPAFPDAVSVSALGRDLVDLARHLAVIDLWIAEESERG